MDGTLFIITVLLWGNVKCQLPLVWNRCLNQWIPAEQANKIQYIKPPCDPAMNCEVEESCPAEPENGGQDGNGCQTVDEWIVIDTDGSADDAMAIAMLINKFKNNTRIKIAGITCVKGSTKLETVIRNVIITLRACCALCSIPIYAGNDFGFCEKETAGKVPSRFGKDAFGDMTYYPKVNQSILRDEHPAIFIDNLIREKPGKVSLLCLGPLTNIAVLAHLHPTLYTDVKHIYYMGGNAPGKEGSENDKLDPYATMAVVNHVAREHDGPKITFFPKDLLKLKFEKEWRKGVATNGNSVRELLDYAEKKVLDVEGEPHGGSEENSSDEGSPNEPVQSQGPSISSNEQQETKTASNDSAMEETKHPNEENWMCESPLVAVVVMDPGVVDTHSNKAVDVKLDTSTKDFIKFVEHKTIKNPNVKVIDKMDTEKIKKMIEHWL